MNAVLERWLPVVGFEGLYSVSDLGRLRRESKVVSRKTTAGYRISEKIMSPGAGVKSGYFSVILSKDGATSTHYVHHLVLGAFVGARPVGQEACHGDGDRGNNAAANLRWDTRKANHADKKLHGTGTVGERHPGAKLSDPMVASLRKRRAEGASFTTLSNEFGITRMTAHRAATGASWSHIA